MEDIKTRDDEEGDKDYVHLYRKSENLEWGQLGKHPLFDVAMNDCVEKSIKVPTISKWHTVFVCIFWLLVYSAYLKPFGINMVCPGGTPGCGDQQRSWKLHLADGEVVIQCFQDHRRHRPQRNGTPHTRCGQEDDQGGQR